MKKLLITLALVCASFAHAAAPQDESEGGVVLFTPPTGWHTTDPSEWPPHIKILVKGSGPSAYPPSMNLNVFPFKGTLKQHLKFVKEFNESNGREWKDLGTIRTEAGNASLSQFEQKTQYGNVRMMQVTLIRGGMVYILTASALVDEFSLFYKDFFNAMRSLRIAKDPIDMLNSSQQKTQLRNAIQNLKSQWTAEITKTKAEETKKAPNELAATVFNSPDFQKADWLPFKEMISQKYGMMGADWQTLVLNNTEKELFDTQN